MLAADAAAPAASESTDNLNEVIVTGTRQTGIKASDSAAPIQVVSATTLEKVAGKPDLITALAQIVPSLTAQSFGGDQANQTLLAKLRGLSPNDVLVLVNGKRRHTTANLAVLSGPYQGGAGVDLNFIPVAAIDHIEVLTDGAAAQYGSDAIAGVINVILKKGSDGGDVGASYGQYYDGGGQTADYYGNVGFEPLDNSFMNFTAEVRHHGFSNRGAIDPRVVAPTTYPNTNEFNAPGYPYLNTISGDGESETKIAFLNAGFALGGGVEFYTTASFAKRDADSFENYRVPSRVSYTPAGETPGPTTTSYLYPFGFQPREATEEQDYQITAGFKGTVLGWNWDVSAGYGRDYMDIFTRNSANADLYALTGTTPTDFYDGSFRATQSNATVDFSRDFDIGLAGPLNVAFGGEARRDGYAIGAGSPASYYGGGAQSYPGFNAKSITDASRKNYAAYVDLAAKPIEGLTVDAAGRFEHYTDFGSKTVYKLTARYDIVPQFAVRGTISTGFRAPTLAEEYYTTTNVGPSTAVVQLAPNSVGAKDLGLGAGLAPETSRNYSVGFVAHPVGDLTATLDLFRIDIKNRIVGSGTINASVNGVVVAPAVTAAIIDNGNSLDPAVVASGATSVSLFTNGVDTKTQGADLVLDYPMTYSWSKIDYSVGATYNSTTASNIRAGGPLLAGQGLFDQTAISDLTSASPKYTVNLGVLLSVDRLTVNLREQIFGKSSEYVTDNGATFAAGASAVNNSIYYKDEIGVSAITNLDIGFKAWKGLTLTAGANNLFNRYPNKVNGLLQSYYYKSNSNAAVAQYPSFSPYGFNGGFYYVRADYSF